MPIALRMVLTAPRSALSSSNHRTATATPLSTDGMNRMVRNSRIPHTRWLSSSAVASPTTR